MQTEDNMELMLLRNKATFLEDKINTLEKSVGKINIILGRFQMTEGKDNEHGFKDLDTHELI